MYEILKEVIIIALGVTVMLMFYKAEMSYKMKHTVWAVIYMSIYSIIFVIYIIKETIK